MRNYIAAIVSIVALSGCASTQVSKEVAKTNSDYENEYHVIAELCTNNPENKKSVQGKNAVRTELMNSSGPYTLKLHAYTVDQMSIFRGNIGAVKGLTYIIIPHRDNTSFLFKRDFSMYKINEWSFWEYPDSLIKEGKEVEQSFFWLATRENDRTKELKRLPYAPYEDVRVRFKIMKFKDALDVIDYRDNSPIEKDVTRCM